MNPNECPCSGWRRGLLLVLFTALAVASAACSNPEKAKAEHVARGEAYLKEKKWQEASLEFRNAIQIDDRLAAAHWGLARAYEGLGQIAPAFDELRRTAELDPNNLDARVRLGNYYILAYQSQKDDKLKDEALRLANDVLQRDANHIEGHILKGTIFYTLGERGKALEELNTAIRLDPNRVESLLSLALYYRQEKDTARAEELYRRAISINDNSSLAHLEYAKFLAGLNRPDAAEGEFRKAVEVDPQNREARRLLTSYYIALRQLDKAEAAAKGLAELDRDKPEGRAVLADFYTQVGRPDDAIRTYNEIIQQAPDYTVGRVALAELLMQRGDVNGALAQVEEALKRNANDTRALTVRARARTAAGEPKQAVEDLKLVLKQDPRSQAGLYNMAEASYRAGQLEQARIYASDLAKYYPDFLPAKLMQAQINLGGRDWAAAQRQANELLDRLAKAAPGGGAPSPLAGELRAKALTVRAMAALQSQPPNTRAARADLEAAREAAPNAADSYINLAAVAAAEKKVDEAAQQYERALSIDPTRYEALNGLLALYNSQGKFDQAHARVDQAISTRPNSAPLHFLKAQIYGAQRDAQGAERTLRRTLEIDPNFIPALNSLGALYLNTNQPDRAIAEFNAWAQKRGDDPVPHMLLGMTYDAQKRQDDAVKAYQKALSLNPDLVIAANNLAWNYAEYGKGNLDEAVRLAQGVMQKYPEEPSFADTLGWVYYKKGLHTAAVDQLQKAVRLTEAKGGNPTLYRYHLGLALAAAGRKPEARQQLQTALNVKERGLPPEQAEEARRALATL